MIFNINSGGIVAKLTVHFPAGSVVSASCDGITLHANNGPLDTQYTFLIPFVGDWVISIVIDGITTTQTITVTPGYNHATAPAIKLYIFNRGDQCASITGGWQRWGYNHNIVTNYPNGYLRIGNEGDYDGGLGTVNAFIIPTWAKYFKGIMKWTGTARGGSIGLTVSRYSNDAAVLDSYPLTAGVEGVVSTDISSLAGGSYIAGRYLYGAHHNDDDSLKPYIGLYMYELWFESDTSVSA